jgi:hypothetical protein
MAKAQAITDKYGVRKPIINEAEINKTLANSRRDEGKPQHFAALISKIAATEILRSNNAKPGAP